MEKTEQKNSGAGEANHADKASQVAYNFTNDVDCGGVKSVSIVVNGESQIIKSDHENFDQILEILRKGISYAQENADQLVKLMSVKKAIEPFISQEGVEIREESIYYNGEIVNNTIVDVILEYARNNFDYSHLIKFLANLMENPSKRSVDLAYGFLSKYNMPITEDGCFLSLKSVTSDYRDHYSNQIDNSVGQIVKLNRNKVSDDPNHQCHYGLHCGWHTYVSTFGAGDNRIIMVKVNPKNIVCVPNDHDMQKMRVCEYEVIKDMGSADEFRSKNGGQEFEKMGNYVEKPEREIEVRCFECGELNEDCDCCRDCGHIHCICDDDFYCSC